MTKRRAKLFGAIGLLTVLLGVGVRQSAAAPIVMYVRWVGDRGGSPDGAQLRYCDWTPTPTGGRAYNCIRQVSETSDANNATLSELPDPVGGIGSTDIDGDGKMEFLAPTESAIPGGTDIITGEIVPGFGTNPTNPNLATVTFGSGSVFSFPTLPNIVGFGVGHASLGAGYALYVAHSADQKHLTVDYYAASAGTPHLSTLSAPVPFTKIIPGDPTNDFLGFTVDDYDGDGIDDSLTLRRRTGPNGMPETVVESFNTNGFGFAPVTLARDPITSAMAAVAHEQTTVVGFLHVRIEDPRSDTPAAREFVVITAGRDPIGAPSIAAELRMWRFDTFGNAIDKSVDRGEVILGSPTGYSGATILGFAGLSPTDFSCNGIDDDHDGKIDEDFVQTPVPDCGGKDCGTGNTACGFAGIVTQCPLTTVELLDGLDNDCNGVFNDIGTMPCAPGQTDWWCCPTGELHFNVNQVVNASGAPSDTVDEMIAANACLPTGVAQPGAVCSLRGVVRRAEQLRGVDGVRPACRVVAELAAGTHQLSRDVAGSYLNFGGGSLTLKGMGGSPEATIIEPMVQGRRLIHLGMNVGVGKDAAAARLTALGEHPPELVIQNLTLHKGEADAFSQGGGGAILDNDDNPGTTLTIEDSIIDLNHSSQQGGAVMFWTPGALTVRRSLFRNNESPNALANALGGAISVRNAFANIEESSFVRNYAQVGGAIHAIDSSVALLNNTIAENTALARGGGVVGEGATSLSLRFNTITKNFIPAATVAGDHGGGGIYTQAGVALTAYGNIIADNEFNPSPNSDAEKKQSLDCHVDSVNVTAAKNLIGASGTDCVKLGAIDHVLIGDVTGGILTHVRPQFSASELPAPDGAITCHAGNIIAAAGPPGCTLICANAASAQKCVFVPGVLSPALAAFGSGASPSGELNTCPLIDEGLDGRPNTSCTVGAIEANAAMRVLSNGDAQYTITFTSPAPSYIEAFVKQNGVLNVSGDIHASQVANGDGTFTYKKVVPASRYVNGDRIETRFYFYRAGSPGVFLPGPTDQTYYPATTYRSPAATPSAQICKQSNNDMRFALTLGARQAYVEAFVQQNGVQTVAGQITTAPVVNMNGTVTYTRTVAASKFQSTDVVRARFYHYEVQAPGAFRPGPGENVFYPSVVYGTAPRCP